MSNKLFTLIRFITGMLFLLYGISKFYPFMPVPPMQPAAANFIAALMRTGYLWQMVGVIEISAGIMLVTNKYVPLALLLLLPIVANILPYLLLLQSGVPSRVMSMYLFTSLAFLLYKKRNYYQNIMNQ